VVAPPSKHPRAAEPEAPPHDQWVYLDQAGAQQGPFGTAEMRSWFSGGFFDGSLQVRPAGATEQGFAPLQSFPALAGRPQAAPESPAADSGGAAVPRAADTAATWGTALPDQGAAFGTSQVAAIEAGGAAQTAQGQALFLQQKLRQFEESAAAEEQESSAAAAKPKAKPGKGKAKGGGFLGVLKQQVKKAEVAKTRGPNRCASSRRQKPSNLLLKEEIEKLKFVSSEIGGCFAQRFAGSGCAREARGQRGRDPVPQPALGALTPDPSAGGRRWQPRVPS